MSTDWWLACFAQLPESVHQAKGPTILLNMPGATGVPNGFAAIVGVGRKSCARTWWCQMKLCHGRNGNRIGSFEMILVASAAPTTREYSKDAPASLFGSNAGVVF